jgi:hypothetical protein
MEKSLNAARERKKRIAALHDRYRRVATDPLACVYCGMPADTIDHVPPLNWVYSLGVESFERAGVALVLVPACRLCNSVLGDRKLPTVRDRAAVVAEKIRKMLLDHEARWSSKELDELGPNLRSYVEMYHLIREQHQRRMEYAVVVSRTFIADYEFVYSATG